MTVVDVSNLSYAYGRAEALHDVSLAIPEGAFYALLGPNGSGKTTLLQLLTGLRRPRSGRVALLGVDSRALGVEHRGQIGYVAEGQRLPGWMTLERLEAYLAPLYPRWDRALAAELRDRFALDPCRRIGTLSRGERMKAALLCALAPRPRLLLMDEPFTGMDAVVKDDLVRGLLASAAEGGWTVVISSHDINEVELLADWVGMLAYGRLRVHEPMERLRERFRRVTVVGEERALAAQPPDPAWLSVERAGRRLSFVVPNADDVAAMDALRTRFAGAQRVEVQEASLREIFVALARSTRLERAAEVAA
jgi:ABC-2 type transport system ATP-binding protein